MQNEFYRKEVVVKKEGKPDRMFYIGLALTSPASAPGRWELSLKNGEPKEPKVVFQDLGEALMFMASLTDPEVISRAYGFLGSTYKWKPWNPEDVYKGAQITPPGPINDNIVIEALKQSPVLAVYLTKIPNLDALSPQERARITEEIIPWP